MNFFWNLSQERRLHDIGQTARQAKGQSDINRLNQLQTKRSMEKLLLACAAMWSLITEKTGLTEEDLADRMRELDLKDGRRDEKLPSSAEVSEAICPGCHRLQRTRHAWCLYCGQELNHSPFHDLFQV